MLARLGIGLEWWLPLCAALSAVAVLASIGWLFWRGHKLWRQVPDRQLPYLVLVFTVLALGWLGYGLFFMYQRFDPDDALLLFARQPELQQQPLIIGGIAWGAALLMARLLSATAQR